MAGCGEEDGLVFEPSSGREAARGPNYCRSWSRGRDLLQEALLGVYGRSPATHSALVLPSGMAAIGAAMSALAAPRGRPSVLVFGDELYCDVRRTAGHLAEVHRPLLECIAVDVRDHDALRGLFAERGRDITLLHLESCTNPSGQLFDFSLLPELKSMAPNCTVVADNTWLTGALFNPLDNGADVVVESLTKYCSAGRCIGGAVLGLDQHVACILTWLKVFGMFVGRDHCDIFLSGLRGLRDRVSAASAAALHIALHLESHPAVSRVMYPMLESHPTNPLARRYLQRGGPGCVWFHLSASKNKVVKAIRRMSTLDFRTSFGGARARVDPWLVSGPSIAYEFPRPGDGRRWGNGVWLRLALGYNQDVKDVVTLLNALLADVAPRTPLRS